MLALVSQLLDVFSCQRDGIGLAIEWARSIDIYITARH
jgi:hypothetical protein